MEASMVIAALIAMGLDILSGIAFACKTGTMSSSKMREGFWLKFGWIGIIAVAWYFQLFAPYFAWSHGADASLSGALDNVIGLGVDGVCLMCVINEMVSVVENLCAINPDIANSVIGRIFRNDEKVEDSTTHDNHGDTPTGSAV